METDVSRWDLNNALLPLAKRRNSVATKRRAWRAPRPLRWAAGLFSISAIGMLCFSLALSGGRFDASAFNVDIAALLAGSIEPGASLALQRSVFEIAPEGLKLSLDGVRLTKADGNVIAMEQTEATLPWLSLLAGDWRPQQMQVSGGMLSFDLTNDPANGAPGHQLVTGSLANEARRPEWLDLIQGKARPGPQLSIKDMSLSLRLDAHKPPLLLSGISLRREKTEKGEVLVLNVPDLGPAATLRILPQEVSTQDGNMMLAFALYEVDAAKLARVAGASLPLSGTARISASGSMALNSFGVPQAVQADIRWQQDAPVMSLAGQILWQQDAPEITLSSFTGTGNEWSAKLDGWLAVSETGFTLRAENGSMSVLAGSSPVEAQNIAFQALFDRANGQITVPAFGANLGEVRIEGHAEPADTPEAVQAYTAQIRASQADIAVLRKRYPGVFKPEIDKALAQLQSGLVRDAVADFRFSVDPYRGAGHSRWTGKLLRFKARFSRLASSALDDVPALSRVDGVVSAQGDRWKVDASTAIVHLAEGASHPLDRLSIRFEAQPNGKAKGEVEASFSGPVGALRDKVAKLPIDAEIGKALSSLGNEGKADVTVSVPIAARLKDSMNALTLQASLKGARLSNTVEGQNITDVTLLATSSKGRIEIKGDGKLRGIPVGLSFSRASARAAGKPQLTATLDEAARDTLGLPFGKALRGKIKLLISPSEEKEKQARVEIDLTAARIIELVPGWNKPAGRKASARMTIRDAGKAGIAIEDLVLDGGNLSARGALTLRRDGGFESAKLSSLRLPGGEKGSATISKQGAIWNVALETNSLDARPWMKRLDEMSSGSKVPVALSLSATALQGHNGEIIGGAKLETELDGKTLSQAKFSGTLNGKPVLARLAPKNGQMQLAVSAGDAGALMRFANIYTRMWGGRIDSRISLKNGSQIGAVLVQNFVLADEPALRGIVAQTGIKGSTTRTAFSVGRLRFERDDSRLKLREAVMWGDAVGGNITGEVDYGMDTINLAGSFVPAYALNNLFAKLPLVGAVLGGESYEGLFAVPFTITGRASSPKLTVNALSAVAPGILRKLLDFKEKPVLEPVSLDAGR
jgi:hypothetical protein